MFCNCKHIFFGVNLFVCCNPQLLYVYAFGSLSNKIYIDLNTLNGMLHLLIRLRDIFGVRRMDSHNASSAKETVESCNRTCIVRCLTFIQKTTKPTSGLRLRISVISLLSWGYAGWDENEVFWNGHKGTQ